MNRHPDFNTHDDPADDRWLREVLHDGAAQAPYLDDAGFTARVVQALPPPRRRWLDGLSATIGIAALGLGLLYFTGLLQAPLTQFAGGLLGYFSSVLAQASPSTLLPLLAPLLALYLAGAALLDD